jgi:hypothetical protein
MAHQDQTAKQKLFHNVIGLVKNDQLHLSFGLLIIE